MIPEGVNVGLLLKATEVALRAFAPHTRLPEGGDGIKTRVVADARKRTY